LAVKILKRIKAEDHSSLSVWIESQVAIIIKNQERKGFKLRLSEAQKLSFSLEKEKEDIHQQATEAFPPKVEHIQLKTKVKTKITPFNPGSRTQVIERLMSLGWKPTKFTTETERPKLDEDVLIDLPNKIDHPLVHLLARYFKIIKYSGMVRGWVKYANVETHRVHGKVVTNGAVTGRMTHNTPNLGQIPTRDPEFGSKCRSIFTVEEGHVLLGSDAKGLEERMLAHYINIPKYTETVLVDGHTMRRDILGFSEDKAGRDKAKKWFYAWLYGGQDFKLGQIALEGTPGMSEAKTRAEGKRTAQLFESKIDGLKKLKDGVMWYYNNGKRIPSLDGRMLEMRAKHSMLNTLLQGAGAVVMKVALITTYVRLKRALGGSFCFVVNVHDEFQNELYFNDPTKVELARSTTLESFELAGKALGVRCPIEADAKVGIDWSETH
jgi:DNA polymerase I-like protein with 3'-5' exonuclease and polymerase domains